MISRALGRFISAGAKKNPLFKDKSIIRSFANLRDWTDTPVPDWNKFPVNHFHTLNGEEYIEVFNHVTFATTVDRMGQCVRYGASVFTDELLAMMWKIMSDYDFQRNTEAMDTYILPFTIAQIKKFTNNHGTALGQIITYAGNYGITDATFWQVVKERLIKDNLHRYIPLNQIGFALRAMAKVGQADEKIVQALGGQVIKHQASLTPENLHAADEGVTLAGINTQAFHNAIEDRSKWSTKEGGPKKVTEQRKLTN